MRSESLHAPGRAPRRAVVLMVCTLVVVLVASITAPPPVQAAPGDGSISGTVFRNGAPDSNGRSYVSAINEAGRPIESGRIDVDGTYTISNLPPGIYVVELADSVLNNRFRYHPGVARPEDAVPVDVATGAEVTGIDIAMRDTATITGTVTGANGLAMGDVIVAAYEHPATDTSRFARTDSNGNYSIVVPAVPTVVSFSAGPLSQGYNSGTGFDDATPIAAAALDVITGVDAVLPTGGLTGTLTDAGVGLADTSVTVRSSVHGQASFQTDSTGNFNAPLLPAGDYTIRVRHTGRCQHRHVRAVRHRRHHREPRSRSRASARIDQRYGLEQRATSRSVAGQLRAALQERLPRRRDEHRW